MDPVEKVVSLYFQGFSVAEALKIANIEPEYFKNIISASDNTKDKAINENF